MLKHQQLSIDLSKLRSELNKIHLDGFDATNEEQVAKVKELRTKIEKAEVEYREALAKEPEPEKRIDKGEETELRAMLKKTNVTQFIDDILGNGSTDDRKLIDEVRSGTGIQAGYFPIDLLLKEDRQQKTDGQEDRVTAAPTTDVTVEKPFLPYLFPQSGAAYLGVATEMVDPGTAEYPRISAKVTTARAAGSAEISNSDVTVASTGLSPARFGANTTYKTVDSLRWAGYTDALTDHLREAISDAFDVYVLKGASNGFETTSALTTVDASAEFAYGDYLGLFGAAVDGRYASEASDVRLLCHPDGYAHALSKLNAAGESALEGSRRIGGGLRASANLSAKSSMKILGILAKGIGRRNATAAIWRGAQIQEDSLSRNAFGETHLHVTMFADFRIVDPGGFARHEIQVG